MNDRHHGSQENQDFLAGAPFFNLAGFLRALETCEDDLSEDLDFESYALATLAKERLRNCA